MQPFQKIQSFTPEISEASRKTIIQHFKSQKEKSTKTHFLHGRWENLYLNAHDVPEVRHCFNAAITLGKRMMNKSFIIPHQGLGFSFDEYWFNEALPGEKTGWHNHKESAALSGVYYLDVPEKSGNIQFRTKINEGWDTKTIQSKTGMMILFDSTLDHSVEINNSLKPRLSLAFNLYTSPVNIQSETQNFSFNKFYS